MNDIQKEMQQLTEQLLYHARRYYNDDAPEISDFEYDKKFTATVTVSSSGYVASVSVSKY